MIILLALVTGLAASLMGLGGGSVMVPSLVYFFKYSTQDAITTSLLVTACLSTSGFISFYIKNKFKITKSIWISLILFTVGSLLGSRLSLMFSETQLNAFVSIAFFLMASILILSLKVKGYKLSEDKKWKLSYLLFSSFGFVLGLTGLGGGIFSSFLLLFLVKNSLVAPLTLLFVALGSSLSSVFFISQTSSPILYEDVFWLFSLSFLVTLAVIRKGIVLKKSIKKSLLFIFLILLGIHTGFFLNP